MPFLVFLGALTLLSTPREERTPAVILHKVVQAIDVPLFTKKGAATKDRYQKIQKLSLIKVSELTDVVPSKSN